MKNKSGLFQLMALIMAGFSSCSEPESPVTDFLPTSISLVFPLVHDHGDDTIPDYPPDGNTGGISNASTVRAFLNPALTYDSIADIEGNIYKTIIIGSQTWMAENLKTTLYNDGTVIPHVTDNSQWVTLKTGAYRWYMNDKEGYKDLFGALYNWYTVRNDKLCPAGWHVPGDEEWKTLEMELGMTSSEADDWGEFPGVIARGTDQGSQLKAARVWMQWEGKGDGGTNTSGFTALPAGESGWGGNWPSQLYTYFCGAGVCTTWWDSTNEGGGRMVTCGDAGVIRGIYPAFCGFSVRCVKD